MNISTTRRTFTLLSATCESLLPYQRPITNKMNQEKLNGKEVDAEKSHKTNIDQYSMKMPPVLYIFNNLNIVTLM